MTNNKVNLKIANHPEKKEVNRNFPVDQANVLLQKKSWELNDKNWKQNSKGDLAPVSKSAK